jgi:hypothetical protein
LPQIPAWKLVCSLQTDRTGEALMALLTTRFDSIEEAQEYIGLLREVVDETRSFVTQELAVTAAGTSARHDDALRLVDYKLVQLHEHLRASGRLLNDLRTLRRILYSERGGTADPSSAEELSSARTYTSR